MQTYTLKYCPADKVSSLDKYFTDFGLERSAESEVGMEWYSLEESDEISFIRYLRGHEYPLLIQTWRPSDPLQPSKAANKFLRDILNITGAPEIYQGICDPVPYELPALY